jgi:hypothetical protein
VKILKLPAIVSVEQDAKSIPCKKFIPFLLYKRGKEKA